jgi:hypothetical protein
VARAASGSSDDRFKFPSLWGKYRIIVQDSRADDSRKCDDDDDDRFKLQMTISICESVSLQDSYPGLQEFKTSVANQEYGLIEFRITLLQ